MAGPVVAVRWTEILEDEAHPDAVLGIAVTRSVAALSSKRPRTLLRSSRRSPKPFVPKMYPFGWNETDLRLEG
jgi:hypothetical protein